ncbi:hypothetical protein QAD02_007906 [Eretmocerus hayati]|uniref:Uncharacterized protein n=1 Tax=Eretmocerus hayati TaxID=131215 RepID=A0ACC2N7D3_9HYME|nr:hypothetical protein QAD02_007906 [Eretmocerus hayati]
MKRKASTGDCQTSKFKRTFSGNDALSIERFKDAALSQETEDPNIVEETQEIPDSQVQNGCNKTVDVVLETESIKLSETNADGNLNDSSNLFHSDLSCYKQGGLDNNPDKADENEVEANLQKMFESDNKESSLAATEIIKSTGSIADNEVERNLEKMFDNESDDDNEDIRINKANSMNECDVINSLTAEEKSEQVMSPRTDIMKQLLSNHDGESELSERKGPVRVMDLNPFQSNLLATRATKKEIYIWDLNNTNKPMSPGSKSMPAEDVQHIAWNKQVQHILASTFSQRCVIWNLKKNEAIIKLTDATSRVRWKSVQWHPDVATQLCLASEEDQSPIIELWDLRFATSPLKTLQSHQRGVLSIAWNMHDSDLLLSCAKDNRILCWNPNSDAPNGEVTCELAQTNQWNFDVLWCPRHPGLIVGTSFDGLATVYSLLGGHNQGSAETSNKIADSFPGMDPFTQARPIIQTEPAAFLKKAPKRLRTPVGASFGFGGKLTIFENEPVDPNMPPNSNRKVFVSQVVTNPELVKRSNELEPVLKSGEFSHFCQGKIDSATDEHKRKVWSCINAYFGENVKLELLTLLGFNITEMDNNLNQYVPQQDIDNLTDGVSNLNNMVNGNAFDGNAAFEAIAAQEQNRKSTTPSKAASKLADTNFKINTSSDDDGLITQAILLGNIEAAVSLCFENKRYADALILSMAGGPDLLARTQYKYFSEHSGSVNSLINSLVSENWLDVVKGCDLSSWKEALIGVFIHTKSEERTVLCDILGDRLAARDNANLRKEAQICYICSGNINKTVETSNCNIQETVELGNLQAALGYLGNSQEPRIVELRDRLLRSLGHIQVQPQRPNPARNTSYTQNAYGFQQQQQAHHPHHLQQPGPGGLPPPLSQQIKKPVPGLAYQNPAAAAPAWNTVPTKQTFPAQPPGPFGGPISNQPNATHQLPPDPYANQFGGPPAPMQPMTPAAAVPPPPPPTSATQGPGSRPPSVGPTHGHKSKYILDPSVKSGPSYGSPSGPGGYPQQPAPQMFGVPQSNSGFGASPGSAFHPQPSPYQPQQPGGGFGGYGGGVGSNPAMNTLYNPAEPELQQQLELQKQNAYGFQQQARHPHHLQQPDPIGLPPPLSQQIKKPVPGLIYQNPTAAAPSWNTVQPKQTFPAQPPGPCVGPISTHPNATHQLSADPYANQFRGPPAPMQPDTGCSSASTPTNFGDPRPTRVRDDVVLVRILLDTSAHPSVTLGASLPLLSTKLSPDN